MRKLLKLQLTNFQKHSNLTIEFDENYNVITGETGAGKTVIFRAVEWLCNSSDISEEDYRKENTKETSVKGWFDNGFQVERIRTNSINRYILSTEGADDKVFDSFGVSAPEEIRQVFRFEPIDIEKEHLILNFSNQDQLNFLIDNNYSDTFKAQLFNKLTGNEILDTVFKDLNKENLRISREIKENEEKIEKQKNDLVEYSEKYKICKDKITNVKESYAKIKEEIEIYNHLKDLAEKLKANKDVTNVTLAKLKEIKIVSDNKLIELKKKAEKIETLKNLFNKIKTIEDQIKKVKETKINVVDIDFEDLKKKSNCIDSYNILVKNIQEIVQKQKINFDEMKRLKAVIASTDKELKELWDSCGGNCPLCKQGIKHE